MNNYQHELDNLISTLTYTPKLLLHACCAPCSSYCVEYLSKYFEITLLFYNPNISDEKEYDKRATELERLISRMEEDAVFPRGRVKVLILPYDPESFHTMAKGLEQEPERGARCRKCYELRMRKAAEYAAGKTTDGAGYEYFTTTLSISPLKNAQWINEIGEELAEQYGVSHLPSDFKKKSGYQRSIELSKEYDLYRQNYCGCVYSQKSLPPPGEGGAPAPDEGIKGENQC